MSLKKMSLSLFQARYANIHVFKITTWRISYNMDQIHVYIYTCDEFILIVDL